MNVVQVLAVTSTLFVLFAIVWVLYVEDWLEQREMNQTSQQTERTSDDKQAVHHKEGE